MMLVHLGFQVKHAFETVPKFKIINIIDEKFGHLLGHLLDHFLEIFVFQFSRYELDKCANNPGREITKKVIYFFILVSKGLFGTFFQNLVEYVMSLFEKIRGLLLELDL